MSVNFRRNLFDSEDPLEDIPFRPLPLPQSQKGSIVSIKSEFGTDDLLFDCMVGDEKISGLFQYHIRFHSTNETLDMQKNIGKNLSICITTQKKEEKRFFAGTVAQAKTLQSYVVDTANEKYLAYYSVVLRPSFWWTTLNKACRIFVKEKTKDIIEKVLKENNVKFTNKTNSAGNVMREYCVQYNESDFIFVSRLMEEEGIFYFFEYSESCETMILADSNDSAVNIGKFAIDIVKTNAVNCITLFNSQDQIVAKKFAAIDHDYMNFGTLLKATGSGSGLGGEVFEYPGGFKDSDGASKVGTKRMEEICSSAKSCNGRSNVLKFCAGSVFELDKHTRSDVNTKYLIHAIQYSIDCCEYSANTRREYSLLLTNKFTASQFDIPFAPQRATRKPVIHGFQTATVVGPSDKEIHCDEHGRVYVQFHWDREGANDGENSCPIRWMQGWAGNGFGLAFVPRIGMEVLVAFENGDPDLPIIVGCLYNSVNKVPDEVSKEPRIVMLKTQTSPEKDGNANVMSFDDTQDKEKITFNASKDFELSSIAKENIFLVKQEGEKTTNQLQIADGLFETTIKKGEKKTIIEEGNYFISLKKGSMTIEQEDGDNVTTLTKGNYVIKIDDGEINISAKKDITVKTDAALSVTAQKDITLKSNSSIVLKATKDIELNATGEVKITATKNITEKATMDVNVEGMNIKQKATMDLSTEGMNIKQKAQLGWSSEGLNWGGKGTLEAKVEALMVTCKATTIGTYGGLQATLDGSVMSTTKGGAVAALKGGLNMIG
ncbi:MAG: type VI secretion system tip protein VgrG [Holosporales bacterium]|jgi:type VI secretion system secreted protein VgrG|nr:type VI secretion system tip protein VgrG [Holosporales bacterium]